MLTDANCRNATCPPDKKRARLTDSRGLYLEVSPAGSKRWFLKMYRDNKETRLALGSYPAVNLLAARRARDAAKLQKSAGIDPVAARKVERLKATVQAGETFALVANAWFDKSSDGWSEHHRIRERRNLDKDLIPYLSARKIGEIESVELLATVRRVEARGSLDVAHRVLGTARGVWRYAVATGVAGRNVALDLEGALIPHQGKHLAAITKPAELAQLIRAIRAYLGGPIVRTALQLAPMLFQRPTELRAAEWAEIDLDAGVWTIAARRMKRNRDGKEFGDAHLVPLPRQAVALLRDLHPLTGDGVLVFPGERSKDRPISDAALRVALQTLGYGPTVQSVHGFRATARTILDEVLEHDPLVIEAQLAHTVKDANGRAYNRTSYIKQRAAMMQAWADYLDKLALGNVVGMDGKPIKRKA